MPFTDSGLWLPRNPKPPKRMGASTILSILSLAIAIASAAATALLAYLNFDINRRTFSTQHKPLLATRIGNISISKNGSHVLAFIIQNIGEAEAVNIQISIAPLADDHEPMTIHPSADPLYPNTSARAELPLDTQLNWSSKRISGALSYFDRYKNAQPLQGFCFDLSPDSEITDEFAMLWPCADLDNGNKVKGSK